jgi:hypothetical protein
MACKSARKPATSVAIPFSSIPLLFEQIVRYETLHRDDCYGETGLFNTSPSGGQAKKAQPTGRATADGGRRAFFFDWRLRDGGILRFVELVSQKPCEIEEVNATRRVDFDEIVSLRVANGHHRSGKDLQVLGARKNMRKSVLYAT